MFQKFIININDTFLQLSKSCEFENMSSHRKVANIIDYQNNLIPLVRTTSKYDNPIQKFQLIHYDLIEKIKKITNNDLKFNNAMVEIYNSEYRTMKYHTDQSLDLADNSYICLFSCYENPDETNARKLKIMNKTTSVESEILLDNNSIVLFSTETNSNYQHKIILDSASQNRWLGITFRLSKTFINFIENVPYFYQTNKILYMATHEEKNNFYKFKSQENLNVKFVYPEINYTISISDISPIM